MIFKKDLQTAQITLTSADFEKLFENANAESNKNNIKLAEKYALNAKTLAEYLKDYLLIGRSLFLLGKIQPNRPENIQTAALYFQESINTFAKIEKTLETRKWVGFVLNDWASRNLNPDYIHTEKEKMDALYFLNQVWQMIRKYPSPAFLELEVTTILNISNYFLIVGNTLTQIFWLEEADKLIAERQTGEIYLYNYFEIHLRLQRSYRRIGEYEKAFISLEKLNNYLNKFPNDLKMLDYYRQLEDSFADVKKYKEMFETLDKGIALTNQIKLRREEFYVTKILRLLQENRISEAKLEFNLLENLRDAVIEKIDKFVIQAVIAGYEKNFAVSDENFSAAEKVLTDDLNKEWINALFLLNWETRIALHSRKFDKLKIICHRYLEIALANNNKDSLPFIYLNLAKAELGLGNIEKATNYNQQAIDLIETKRLSKNAQISVGVMEVMYEAYQFEIQLKQAQNQTNESLTASEKLKSRWLTDKISNNPFGRRKILDESTRGEIKQTTLLLLENPQNKDISEKLINLESTALFYEKENLGSNQTLEQNSNVIAGLVNSALDYQTAVISYAFTNNDQLIAFVYHKGEMIRAIKLPLTLAEADKLAISVHQKIKNDFYFKKNGKEIYDLLLQPLKLEGIKHLIIIPDKSLWKIPFQALSSDGNTFLIENTRISYAPSVAILLNEISLPLPERKSFQVFSNAQFNNYYLQFADSEAKSLATMYGVQPVLSSTVDQFTGRSNKSDIIHFSMHAEFDREPFNSFLAFNKTRDSNGKLTVNDLLNLKLKNQSLVFLASCSTNNVFSSEGLVSLAWGMMGAGATTVISAQWDANDESTEQFTKRFYKYYKTGNTTSEALQKASIEMINLPNDKLSKPFYWAEFTLNGDYR